MPIEPFAPKDFRVFERPHFKVAVSRHCVRFLFEVGPEHPAKAAWARAWQRETLVLGHDPTRPSRRSSAARHDGGEAPGVGG